MVREKVLKGHVMAERADILVESRFFLPIFGISIIF